MQSSHTLKEHAVTLENLRREKQAIDDERERLRQEINDVQQQHDACKRQVESQQKLGLADKVRVSHIQDSGCCVASLLSSLACVAAPVG